MKTKVKRSTLIAAFAVAICADLIEIGLAPAFSEGFFSFFDDVLDVLVGVILTALVGFHVAFLPSFLIKLIPVGDLAPTWTIAVWIATRNLRGPTDNDFPGAQPEKPTTAIETEKPPKILPEGKK